MWWLYYDSDLTYRVDGGNTLTGFKPDDGRFEEKKFFNASEFSDSYDIHINNVNTRWLLLPWPGGMTVGVTIHYIVAQ